MIQELECPCGEEHREIALERRLNAARDVERKGETLQVTAAGDVVYEVPRVYLTYHGERYTSLVARVGIYDWPKVP